MYYTFGPSSEGWIFTGTAHIAAVSYADSPPNVLLINNGTIPPDAAGGGAINSTDNAGNVNFPLITLSPGRQYPVTIRVNADRVLDDNTQLLFVIADSILGGPSPDALLVTLTKSQIGPGWQTWNVGTYTAVSGFAVFEVGVIGNSDPFSEWAVDNISIGKNAKLQSNLNFNGTGFRSRDGDCLTDYPIEPCSPTAYAFEADCPEPILLEESPASFVAVAEPCPVSFYDDDPPAPLSVFNLESDGCVLHDDDQQVSYTPPSRGSTLTFNGRLFKRIPDRFYHGDLTFNGFLKRGRHFLGTETFNGALIKKDKKILRGTFNPIGVVTGVKNANPILALGPWAWFKADNIAGDGVAVPPGGDGSAVPSWQDLSGNGNHLINPGSLQDDGSAGGTPPIWRAANGLRSTTHLAAVDFMGNISTHAFGGFFEFAANKILNASNVGFTLCFIYRNYFSSGVSHSYLFGATSSFSATNEIDGGQGGTNDIQWATGEGASVKVFSDSISYNDNASSDVFVLRCAATTGLLRCWFNGTLINNTFAPTKVSTTALRYIGRSQVSLTANFFTRFKSIGELIIFDKELNNTQVGVVNTWLLGRI